MKLRGLDHYILVKRKPVRVSMMRWAQWMQLPDRRVAHSKRGNVRVSTIFIGIDHNFSGRGAPLLFETMIFGGPHDQWQERCSTWDQAETMHHRACLKAGVPSPFKVTQPHL